MKTIRLTILFLLSPLVFFAQTLTGLWIGSISNDSTTVRKDQAFELVLTQYKDKVYGYSRSTFIVNDTLFYIVKRVKGSIEGDVCEVKDDEVIAYNFKGRIDKKVKMISTFHFDQQDSSWKMDGEWKTNKTKKYYSISGTMDLQEEKDIEKSKIFPHLEELSLADDVAFYKESKRAPEPVAVSKQSQMEVIKDRPVKKEEPLPALARETTTTTRSNPGATPGTTQSAAEEKSSPVVVKENKKTAPVSPENAQSSSGDLKKEMPVVTTETKKEAITPEKQQPVKPEQASATAASGQQKESADLSKQASAPESTRPSSNDLKKEMPVVTTEIKKEVVTPEKKQLRKPDPAVTTATPGEQKEIADLSKQASLSKKDKSRVAIVNNREADKSKAPIAAAFVAERKVAAPQIVNFSSDSLVLALYDNGEVDGDTVSVLLNGEVILAKQGLKASATKKTIYVPPGTHDSMTLVLYAENLGKYPPNTGLLVVYDGEERYQVRFSADLQQNAAIIFKRKPK